MKTMLLITATIILVFNGFSPLASDKENQKHAPEFETVTFPTVDGKLRVNILNSGRRILQLRIKTNKGETIHQDFIGKKEFKTAINYDLSDLDSGVYQVYITDGKVSQTHTFSIAERKMMAARIVSLQP